MRRLRRFVSRGSLWVASVLLVALGAWHAAVSPIAALQRMELAFDDLRQNAYLQPGPHPDIVIVDVDEASLAELGRWPWPRTHFARLVDELIQRQRVAAIGFDFVFAEPDLGAWPLLKALAQSDPALAQQLPRWRQTTDNDAVFAKSLQGRPIVLGYYLSNDRGGVRVGPLPPPLFALPKPSSQVRLPLWNGYGANVATLLAAAPAAGFFNAWPDDDGVVRSVPAVGRVDQQVQPSLALSLARVAAGLPAVEPVWVPVAGREGLLDLVALKLTPPDGGEPRLLALDERGGLRVPYRGRGGKVGGAFRYVPAATLLAGRIPAAELAGKLVLVGSSAPGLADLRSTPVNAAMPGVEVHANLLAGMLDGRLPQRPDWAPGYEVALIIISMLLAALVATRLAGRWAMVGAAALGVSLVASNLLAYSQAGLVLPVATALVLSAILFFGAVSVSYVREWEGRRSLVRLFSSYLPPDRARALARDPQAHKLEAENRELTILFCDLRGFTSIAESLPPLALRDLLNQYLSTATAIVHDHGGTLDKFIGDAVMAFWGAPQPQADHAARAVRAAMALAQGTVPLNQALRARGLPEVGYGIGVATGVVCVGDLGSSARRAYTAVGDAVNLAARLESQTRHAGVGLLVSDTTCHAARLDLPDIAWVEVDQTKVKGRQQFVNIFTPLPSACLADAATQDQLRNWQLALAAARLHHDASARAYLGRLNELLALNSHATSQQQAEGAGLSRSSADLFAGLARRLQNDLDRAAAPSSALGDSRPAPDGGPAA
ncbi:MAG: adenylate/guanylate cyclase domain-containing protein [Ideonella sp. MAG2]|nr:MAG: adenylate/guanylate cyclase domain-containing protein [Ideonella sp. MAG2]